MGVPVGYRPWPDFTGPRPDDWKPLHWVAALAIHEGKTQEEAGNTVARSRSTIKGWVRDWRKDYGPSFLPGQPSITDENRGSHLGGEATARKWEDIRRQQADEFGEVARLAHRLAARVLESILGDDAKIAQLDALDFDRIMRGGDRAAAVADRLASINGGTVGGGDAGIPDGLLKGLETAPGQHSTVLDRLDLVVTRYRVESTGSAEVIETTAQ